jgi:hypothetical protein
MKTRAIHCAPALIDPPTIYDSLERWLEFRANMVELQRSDVPHISPFICEADRIIARLRKGEGPW